MEAFEPRREPVLDDLRITVGGASESTFLRDARLRGRRASRSMWMAACLLAVVLIWFNLAFHLPEKASLAYTLGIALGTFLVPGLVVVISSLWDHQSSQHKNVKVFALTCIALLTLNIVSASMTRGYAQLWLNKSNMSAEDFKAQAIKCASRRDLPCQETNWRDYVALRPEEALGVARLGIVLNQLGKNDEAAIHLKKSIELGAGTYDLFAYFADTQEKLGHTSEAIEWSYKALSVVPTLVDVRGSLARLLVKQNRPYEALSLLQSYDNQLEVRGQRSYFAAQRISIETVIEQDNVDKPAERRSLRLPAYAGHFFAPVSIGTSKPKPFMVDTGASVTSLSEAMLRDSAAVYRVIQPQVKMTTADGRKVVAQGIILESLKVGSFELKNTPAVVCLACVPLLGQASLSNFDMQSSRTQGVDFLVLSRRGLP